MSQSGREARVWRPSQSSSRITRCSLVPETHFARSTQSWRSRGLWALRIAVALVLLYEGVDKFSTSRLWAIVFARIGFGPWFRYATGAIEVTGSVLLLIPRATTVAVVLLSCTMVG